MKMSFLSPKTALSLAVVALVGATPLAGWAKKAQDEMPKDTTYQYVSGVFDKLQSNWEQQAFDQRLNANSTLTFTLGDDGTLLGSQLDAGNGDQASGKESMAFLKEATPFGKFPSGLEGDSLEFKFKLTPGSMQMVSYRVLEDQKKKDSVISYASPAAPGGQAAASLFYARVVDSVETPRVGKVWEKPDVQTVDEQVMNDYVTGIQQKIQTAWKQPGEEVSFAPTVAMIQIDRDGSVLSANIKQSSGNKDIDKAIVETVSNAGPFERVPEAAQSLPVTIEYIFEPVVSTVFVEEQAQ
jgi:TonB family protein